MRASSAAIDLSPRSRITGVPTIILPDPVTPAGLEPLFPEVDELRKRLRPGTAEFRDKLEEMRAKYGVYNGEKWEGITSAEDPTDGTWELDVRASKFNPGSSWRRQTQIYKADGRNIEMIATGINGRGQRIRSGYVGAYDGQDYPVTGDAKGETVAQLRIDYYTVKTTTKIGGKITGASARVISKDGTVMTITTSGADGKAVEFKDTLVFRKRWEADEPPLNGARTTRRTGAAGASFVSNLAP